MKLKLLTLFCLFLVVTLFHHETSATSPLPMTESTLAYTKTDFPGCPENSFCNEETGKTRMFFKEQLKLLQSQQITDAQFTEKILQRQAAPFPLFTKEANHNYKGLALWESHCRQHKFGVRYYQGEIYTHSIIKKNWDELKFIYNPLVLMVDKNFHVIPGLMGESPLDISFNQKYWEATYLREEDGLFYLFHINTEGSIRLGKVQEKLETLKTINCPPELSAEFLRLSESPSFYATTTCKEVKYKINGTVKPKTITAIFGVPCL